MLEMILVKIHQKEKLQNQI